jgi:HSP20 family protein
MFSLIPLRENRGRSGGLMHPLEQMRHEFDTLLNRFFGGWPEPFAGDRGNRLWDFDVTENDNEIVVRAEMPGFDANEIDVQVRGDTLTIAGEKKQQGEQRESFSRFRRSVLLPSGVDTDKAQAKFHNGLLELHLPIREEARAKRIQVQSGNAGQQTAQAGGQAQGAQAAGKESGQSAQQAKHKAK